MSLPKGVTTYGIYDAYNLSDDDDLLTRLEILFEKWSKYFVKVWDVACRTYLSKILFDMDAIFKLHPQLYITLNKDEMHYNCLYVFLKLDLTLPPNLVKKWVKIRSQICDFEYFDTKLQYERGKNG